MRLCFGCASLVTDVRAEPLVDRPALCALLQREYDLDAVDLRFVPVGFSTVCYKVGDSRFLKLWPAESNGGRSAELLDIELPLLDVLDSLEMRARVPAPIRTVQGELRTSFAGQPAALFPLLPGEHAPEEGVPHEPRLWTEMARVMADIHRATPAVAHLPLPRETFGPLVMPPLERCARVVGSRAGELRRHIARFERVRAVAARLPGPRVLCHRDFGGYNVLFDSAGRLSILDWDWPAIAPPEHDLRFAAGDGLGDFIAAYWAAGGVTAIRREQLEFAILRRGLEDLGARATRLLRDDVGEAEAAELHEGIARWGFDRCASVDGSLRALDAQLMTPASTRYVPPVT